MATKSKSLKKKKKKSVATTGPEVWDQWVRQLRKRKPKRPFKGLSQGSVLLWALPADTTSSSIELVQQVDRYLSEKRGESELAENLEQWLSTVSDRRAEFSFALECLAWCHCLPALAEILPAGPWTSLYDTLVGIAEERQLSASISPVVSQMLWGELPLTLEFLIPSCHELCKPARKFLAEGLDELTDGDGTLDAAHWDLGRSLLAVWTRTSWLGKQKKDFALNKAAQERFNWFLHHALRSSRNTGDQVFHQVGNYATAWDPELFVAALQVVDDREADVAATSMIPKLVSEDYPRHSLRHCESCDSSANSEWAAALVMRNGWARKSTQYAQSSSQGRLRGELNSGFATIFSGDLNPTIVLDGKTLAQPKHWIELCWHSDEDADFIEMEAHYGGHCRIQRQALLSRTDGFFLVADAILLDAEAEIEYSMPLPLGESVHFEPADKSREGWLVGKRKLALVLPLSLPEWRADLSDGELREEDGQLIYCRQQSISGALYAPLFLDLTSKRFKKQFTWRQLTIAEQLEIVRRDVAAGFRIHVGDDQFLLYRSLQEGGNRTILGQNLNSEFYLGRFDKNGETEELLEIE